jgi:hypothetical protein
LDGISTPGTFDVPTAPRLELGAWQRLAAPRAFRVAAVACVLALVGLGLDTCFWFSTYHRLPHGHLAAMSAAGAGLAVLRLRRRHPSQSLGNLLFTLNNLVILAALWGTDSQLAHASHWNAFDAQKLGALTVALLTPPSLFVGALNIAVFTFVPIAEFASWEDVPQPDLPLAVPFACLAYGAFALGILALQLRRLQNEAADAQLHAQSAAAERLAEVVLALRDQANTPLQTIELTVARLVHDGQIEPRAEQLLRRASATLIETARVLEDGDREAEATRAPST